MASKAAKGKAGEGPAMQAKGAGDAPGTKARSGTGARGAAPKRASPKAK